MLLGDDLHSNRPFCDKTVEKGRGFIFTRKGDTHQWLTETIKNSYLYGVRNGKWDPRKKKKAIYTRKYLNGLPIRYDDRESF
jgi:ribosomal protein L24E